VIERCKPFFRHNAIVTNGTIPLPNWPEVTWYVSIDGDEEVHEYVRDREKLFRRGNRGGIYRVIMDNVTRNRHLGITIAYCISRENVHCIERVVKDWYEAGARHITFDFFTPVAGLVTTEAGASVVGFSQMSAREIARNGVSSSTRTTPGFMTSPP
jgi:sulfatase maturation enzyme AslB (radical SAM superfamily)